MANGRTPYLLTLVALAVIVVTVLLVQPYSVRSRWQPYVQPARQYLQAALRRDSAALTRQSVSAAPVAWALHAARTAPETLAVWAAALRPATGRGGATRLTSCSRPRPRSASSDRS